MALGPDDFMIPWWIQQFKHFFLNPEPNDETLVAGHDVDEKPDWLSPTECPARNRTRR